MNETKDQNYEKENVLINRSKRKLRAIKKEKLRQSRKAKRKVSIRYGS